MINIKMHMMPGDISKQEKADMLENKHSDKNRSKSFRRMIYSRLRAILKERTRTEINREYVIK